LGRFRRANELTPTLVGEVGRVGRCDRCRLLFGEMEKYQKTIWL